MAPGKDSIAISLEQQLPKELLHHDVLDVDFHGFTKCGHVKFGRSLGAFLDFVDPMPAP